MTFETRETRLSTGALPYRVAGAGQPLLYLHSAGGVRLTEPLAALARSYRVFLPTLPGFDGTPPHAGVTSIRDLAGLAAEFIEREIGAPADVIGHSLGGWTALWLAARHADRIDQLVLECPAGLIGPEGEALSADPATLRRQLFAHPERVPAEEKPLEVLRANAAARERLMQGSRFDEALAAALPEIRALTLVVAGSEDRIVPPSTARLLKARLPRAYLVYIADAAHNPEVDQPGPFTRVVGDFLAWGEGFLVKRA